MFRRVRRLVVALVVLIILIVAAAVLLGNRSALDHARSRVDQRWTALRPPLQTRYTALAAVAGSLSNDLGANARVPSQLNRTLLQWNALVKPGHHDPGVEVAVADNLEGMAAVARVTAVSSDRMKADQTLQAAVANFDKSAPPGILVDAYNAAVRAYEHDRTTGLRRVTAGLLGYGSRRTFEPVSTS